MHLAKHGPRLWTLDSSHGHPAGRRLSVTVLQLVVLLQDAVRARYPESRNLTHAVEGRSMVGLASCRLLDMTGQAGSMISIAPVCLLSWRTMVTDGD